MSPACSVARQHTRLCEIQNLVIRAPRQAGGIFGADVFILRHNFIPLSPANLVTIPHIQLMPISSSFFIRSPDMFRILPL